MMRKKGVKRMKHLKRGKIQILLLLAGIILLCFGVWRKEVETVIEKAVNLCLECVGIG